MNAEDAETYLRTLVEARLRQAMTAPGAPRRDITEGVDRVADALAQVGAIDPSLARAIVAGFQQALDSRVRATTSRPGVRPGPGVARQLPLALFPDLQGPSSPAGRSEGTTAPIRVIPVGRAVPFRDDDQDGMYLAALVVTPDSAGFTAGSWTRDPAGGIRDRTGVFTLNAADDQGTACQLSYNGSGTPEQQAGRYELAPTPPEGAQWLDVTTDSSQPGVRIDLTVPPASASAVIAAASASPGELLLYRVANGLLAYWEPDRSIVSSRVTGLGDVVAALEAAGALPAGSPVPGRLADLCERLGVTGHGIAAPRSDLPETWSSVLAHHLHGDPGPRAGARAASAAFAAALPELDGVRYAVAGLHTGYGQTLLHAVADGLAADWSPRQAGGSWWLRDDTGQWHVTVVSSWGETHLLMQVVPAVDPATTVLELVIDGQAAQLRARLPVSWWSPS